MIEDSSFVVSRFGKVRTSPPLPPLPKKLSISFQSRVSLQIQNENSTLVVAFFQLSRTATTRSFF